MPVPTFAAPALAPIRHVTYRCQAALEATMSKPRPEPTDEPRGPSTTTSLGLFVAMLILMGSDLIADGLGAPGLIHLLVEGGVMIVAAAGALLFWRQWRRERQQRRDHERRVVALDQAATAWRAEAERWQLEARDAARGLTQAIDRQFERWGLSGAEREIGLLLLKGLSLKEVADVRGTSERTVRQQAQQLYRKGGLAGRTELAAYFLEDLLG